MRTLVKEYFECEANTKAKTIKRVKVFNEGLGEHVVYLVNNKWWVVCGDTPVNLYLKKKFCCDEVYSFHLGLMLRLSNKAVK